MQTVQRLVVLRGSTQGPWWVFGTHLFRQGLGIEVRAVPDTDLGISRSVVGVTLLEPGVVALFRAVHAYAVKNGFAGGYPTFSGGTGDYRQTVVLLPPQIAEHRELEARELQLATPAPLLVRLGTVESFAVRSGYGCGFHTFQTTEQEGLGAVLVKQGVSRWEDVSGALLGNPPVEDLPARFRAAHEYAVRQGYVSGIPSGHHGQFASELEANTRPLNELVEHQGWRVSRVEPLSSSERAGTESGYAALVVLELTAPAAGKLLAADISPEHGLCFTARIGHAVFGDDMHKARHSKLVLYEDERPLGPAHSVHEHIRKEGGGRFSHWKDYLYFSSSDKSDPRKNGRVYTWRFEP